MNYVNNTGKKRTVVVNITALVLVVLAAFLVMKYAVTPRKKVDEYQKKNLPTVEVRSLQEEGFRWTIKSYGRIQPAEQKFFSSKVTATISKLNFKVGQRIKAGELLLEFDSSDYQNELLKQKFALHNTQNQLQEIMTRRSFNEKLVQLTRQRQQLAEKSKARLVKLQGTDAEQPIDMDRAQIDSLKKVEEIIRLERDIQLSKSDEQMTLLEIEQAKLYITKALDDINSCLIRMPENGQINSMNIKSGQAVSEHSMLFSYVGNKRIRELRIELSPKEIHRLKINTSSEISHELAVTISPVSLPVGHKPFRAKISRIEAPSDKNAYFPVV
ncbi:MAG: biotin/lipoyl-binding protein, partial [Lentisphaeraceae bacterium]|nr:biotin/lipoyl-binding protein [Lentisphaeraceae bacterium]